MVSSPFESHGLPVGAVLPYAGPIFSLKPAIEQRVRANLAALGWLVCDGAALDPRDYVELYGVIGTSYNVTAKDGQFQLPDYRGRFLRAVDGGAKRDPNIGCRTTNPFTGSQDAVGTTQPDMFQAHEHGYSGVVMGLTPADKGKPVPKIEDLETKSITSDPAGGGAPRYGKETRPINIYINFIVRYRS